MASISVDVDVDLDVFDLDEILKELRERYDSKKNQKQINEFIKRMKIDCEENDNLNLSILDKMKIDFLMQNLNKITLNNLENLL